MQNIFFIFILCSSFSFAADNGSGTSPFTPQEIKQRDQILNQKKIAFVIGGGGEPAGDKTLFDTSLQNTLRALKESSYTTLASFNGGHANTEAILNNQLPSEFSTFTNQNVLSQIHILESVIQKNQLASGAQLIIFINGHGFPKADSDLSHQIATDETPNKNFPVDALTNLQALAKSKKIKLAIIDQGCYSGATQVLADDNTCVISAASATTVAYSDFGQKFGQAMKPGKSLEDVFLETRRDLKQPGLPEISTPAGEAAINSVSQLQINLESYVGDVKKQCDPMNQTQLSKNISAVMAAVQTEVPMSRLESFTLKRQFEINLASYQKAHQEAIELANFAEEEIKLDQLEVSHRDLAELESLVRLAKNKINKLEKPESNYFASIVAGEDRLRAERSRLIENDPKFKNYVEKTKSDPFHLSQVDQKLYDLASQISPTERKIYDIEYRNNLKKESKSACSDFIL